MNYDIPGQGPEARHFGGGAPSSPPPPPPPPQKSDAEIQAERQKVARIARNRKGRGASILAGDTTNFQPLDEQRVGRETLG